MSIHHCIVSSREFRSRRRNAEYPESMVPQAPPKTLRNPFSNQGLPTWVMLQRRGGQRPSLAPLVDVA